MDTIFQDDKKRVIVFIAAIISILVCLSMVSIRIADTLATSADSIPAETEISEAEENMPQYVVSAYNNKIAVFEYGKSYPLEIFDVYVNSLPEPDVVSIQNGIHIYSTEQLRSVIEDYTS